MTLGKNQRDCAPADGAGSFLKSRDDLTTPGSGKAVKHLIAFVMTTIIFTSTSIVLYNLMALAGIGYSGAAGGPLNLILVPLFSFLIALIFAGLLCPALAALAEWSCLRWQISRWVPPIVAFIVGALSTLLLYRSRVRSDAHLPPYMLATIAVVGIGPSFVVYWGALQGSRRILMLLQHFKTRLDEAMHHGGRS